MNSFKKKYSTNTKVIENYFFMTAIQVINSLFGILIYPYLIRVLGAESYGLYVFALSISSYFIVFISFGFTFLAIKPLLSPQVLSMKKQGFGVDITQLFPEVKLKDAKKQWYMLMLNKITENLHTKK